MKVAFEANVAFEMLLKKLPVPPLKVQEKAKASLTASVAVAEKICDEPMFTEFPVAAGVWLAQTGLEFLLTDQFRVVLPTAFVKVADTVSVEPFENSELKKFLKF